MTTKQQSSSPQTVNTISTSTSTSATGSTASRAAAQILYRMPNSNGLITEPITPVLLTTPTMLNSASFTMTPQGFATSSSATGGQNASFIPVYIQQPNAGQGQPIIKQEPGTMTFQFNPQQLQQLQQQQQQQQQQQLQQGGQRVAYVVDPSQYHPNRMNSVSPVSSYHGASGQSASPTKRSGGRRPNKDERLSQEEEDRRRVRRERNKQAAARCRKRRMDQTSTLTEETEMLEEQQNKLRGEIEALQQEKTEIELLLQAHRTCCTKGIPAAMMSRDVSFSPPQVPVEQPRAPSVETTSMQPPPPPPAISLPPASVSHFDVATKAEAKRGQAAGRPVSLPVRTELTQLDLSNNLAMPTPSPSKLVFNFDHSGLTPTGLTPTGLTPLIPSISADATDKNATPQRQPTADGVSPNNLVSL
ncbi:hypothetical protein RvY_11023 [Ramazzottius varieornatus]|uniref:BZIP domain-containing protein n=1 Tax=Ramazzottius varieornatus TaxID=947166 RepID=A0A1D1VES7_RAMVA|nr:hypothetical protein RvY_11023 [Ramazzottius varieornatus]